MRGLPGGEVAEVVAGGEGRSEGCEEGGAGVGWGCGLRFDGEVR